MITEAELAPLIDLLKSAAEQSPWAPWRFNGPGVDEVAATLARQWGPQLTG